MNRAALPAAVGVLVLAAGGLAYALVSKDDPETPTAPVAPVSAPATLPAPSDPAIETVEVPAPAETTTVYVTLPARTVTSRVTVTVTRTTAPPTPSVVPTATFFLTCEALRKVYPNDTVVGDHPAYRGELDSDSDGEACEID